jgi:hypothetical protein
MSACIRIGNVIAIEKKKHFKERDVIQWFRYSI